MMGKKDIELEDRSVVQAMFKVQLAEELAQRFLLIGYFRDQDDYITDRNKKTLTRAVRVIQPNKNFCGEVDM
jgi:hypothetical protein